MNRLDAPRPPAWPVVAQLLDAISRRDFVALQACLHDEARLRALVPSGPFELRGAAEVTTKLRAWFGGVDSFEVADAAIGQVGDRMYARWRVRMWPAGQPHQVRTAEQHVFTTGDPKVSTLDLLCSGFHTEATS